MIRETNVPPESEKLVIDIVRIARRAKAQFKQAGIKAMIKAELSREHSDKLRTIQALGGYPSQSVAIHACIDLMYKTMTPGLADGA